MSSVNDKMENLNIIQYKALKMHPEEQHKQLELYIDFFQRVLIVAIFQEL